MKNHETIMCAMRVAPRVVFRHMNLKGIKMTKLMSLLIFGLMTCVSCGAASTHLSLDNRTGTRVAAATERISFSPAWETDTVGATAVVSIDGVAIKDSTEAGAFDWAPMQGGTYQFSHAVFVSGVQVGQTLTATFVVGGFGFEYFEQTGHAYVKSYSGAEEHVEIPSVVCVDANGRQVADEASAAKAYQVTGISNSAFARNKTMKSVVFPASLQTIGSEAFYGCESLEQVIVPETVTSIGESAFAWCPKLKRAEVLGSLELSANCFAYDSALETVAIGDKVTSLQRGYKDSDGALGSPFLGCEKLREISVGSGITYILPYVFNGLKSLETIRFGAIIRDVYHHAFSGCESLKKIDGTFRPLSVGDSAFSGVPADSKMQFSDCTSIGTAAFWGCKNFGGFSIRTLELPKIESIGDGAFEDCTKIRVVQLGDQLKTIGSNAFKDSGVQVVRFNGPPPSVGEGAFTLSGEPQGLLGDSASYADWQYAIDQKTGMWNGLYFSSHGAWTRYTFMAINDVKGTFDPQKVTAVVNKLVRDADGKVTYVEFERRRVSSTDASCDVLMSADGDYEVWFVYDDETWECSIEVDRFSVQIPWESGREKTVYFRRGNPAWTLTVYLYADEKATEPYTKLYLSSGADAGQDFPAPELSPVELAIGVLPQPPWPTPTWLYEFNGWRRRHYNVQSGKWETGDPIPATLYLGQNETDQGYSLHLVATWKWDLGGDDDFKTWEEVQTGEYDKVVVKSTKIKDGETSELSFTVEDEGVFSFLWKTSTESGRKFTSVSALRSLSSVAVPTWDHAEFLVDGEVVATRDGESQWEKVTINLSGGSPHMVTWRYVKDDSGSAGEDCVWVSEINWIPAGVGVAVPSVIGDEGATVTGDAETGFVVKPSEGKTAVEVTIPQGVDAAKVTVEVSPKVTSVKPNGAKVKVVNASADITEFLNIPAADGNGVVDLTKATVKEEYVKEAMDVEKGAVIDLCSGSQGTASPTITTAPTRMGLFYQLYEGETLDGMKDGDSKVGDGQPWSPEIKVKGGNSAFYSIDVRKNKISFVDIIRRLVDK